MANLLRRNERPDPLSNEPVLHLSDIESRLVEFSEVLAQNAEAIISEGSSYSRLSLPANHPAVPCIKSTWARLPGAAESERASEVFRPPLPDQETWTFDGSLMHDPALALFYLWLATYPEASLEFVKYPNTQD